MCLLRRIRPNPSSLLCPPAGEGLLENPSSLAVPRRSGTASSCCRSDSSSRIFPVDGSPPPCSRASLLRSLWGLPSPHPSKPPFEATLPRPCCSRLTKSSGACVVPTSLTAAHRHQVVTCQPISTLRQSNSVEQTIRNRRAVCTYLREARRISYQGSSPAVTIT